jgi:hypothetical protein
MAEAKTALDWLERFQGIKGEGEILAGPLATAERLSTLVGEAARTLPFGAEPPDFLRALEALAPKEARDGE